MATETMSALSECGDAELVSQSRAGNRDAFGQIVARYQTLICSLTYNTTGSLSQSQDVAQETFVTAWKQIRNLREPNRLRSWLCGIARNLSHNALRQNLQEPANASEPLEVARAVASPDLPPSDQAISREEEAILWRALEGIPSVYGEPLILFYREHRSVEQVARTLELSPDAVKQRLARGRKMLHQEVAAFVESALQRTTPGKAFTLAVLAALPVFAAGSATAVTVGTAGAKVTTGAKITAAAGLAGSILGPLIGLLGGAFGIWISIRNTRSPRERRFMIRQSWISAASLVLFAAALSSFIFLGRPLAASHPVIFGCALGLSVAGYWTGMVIWMVRSNRRQWQIRVEDGTDLTPMLATPTRKHQLWAVYGSLGGSTFGVLGWVVAQAVQANEWVTGIVTVLFGTAVVLVGARVWMRDPEARGRVIVPTLTLLGLFIVAVGLAHWGDWTKAAEVQVTATHTVLIGSGLAAIALIVGVFRRFRGGPCEASTRGQNQNSFCLMPLVPLLLSALISQSATPANPRAESWTLPNHIRLVSVLFPDSTNVSIFTFLPLGLAEDGREQTQWSHLVEHLVIRSTVSKHLSIANGETMPESMRLDFYGNVNNWEAGLSHHRRWLEGVPFTETSLEREKPKVKSECDFTVRNLATHKLAMAAWAQGLRHGATNVALLGDIARASLSQIQAYRDEHLAVLSNVLVCVVGGVEPSRVSSVAREQLGAIKSGATPVAPVKLHPGNRELTWDLDARHLIITWPMPATASEDFAPLLAAGQWLNMRFFSDPEIKRLTGMSLAGADLATPEGNFFFVSASLRPGIAFPEVQQKLEQKAQGLSAPEEDLSMLAMLSGQLAESLTTIPEMAALKAQLPPNTDLAMVEGNIGLQWGMAEFRYGSGKATLAKRLPQLRTEDVRRVAKKYLAPGMCSVTEIRKAGIL